MEIRGAETKIGGAPVAPEGSVLRIEEDLRGVEGHLRRAMRNSRQHLREV
jgi:hypothetical protein